MRAVFKSCHIVATSSSTLKVGWMNRRTVVSERYLDCRLVSFVSAFPPIISAVFTTTVSFILPFVHKFTPPPQSLTEALNEAGAMKEMKAAAGSDQHFAWYLQDQLLKVGFQIYFYSPPFKPNFHNRPCLTSPDRSVGLWRCGSPKTLNQNTGGAPGGGGEEGSQATERKYQRVGIPPPPHLNLCCCWFQTVTYHFIRFVLAFFSKIIHCTPNPINWGFNDLIFVLLFLLL